MSRFEWLNRTGCVDALAAACMDRNMRFEQAVSDALLRRYALFPEAVTKKTLSLLKRDVTAQMKELKQVKQAPQVGDIVKVVKQGEAHPNLGSVQLQSRQSVQAEVVAVDIRSYGMYYTVKRLADGIIQQGNGHMIKGIIQRAEETEEMAYEG